MSYCPVHTAAELCEYIGSLSSGTREVVVQLPPALLHKRPPVLNALWMMPHWLQEGGLTMVKIDHDFLL